MNLYGCMSRLNQKVTMARFCNTICKYALLNNLYTQLSSKHSAARLYLVLLLLFLREEYLHISTSNGHQTLRHSFPEENLLFKKRRKEHAQTLQSHYSSLWTTPVYILTIMAGQSPVPTSQLFCGEHVISW